MQGKLECRADVLVGPGKSGKLLSIITGARTGPKKRWNYELQFRRSFWNISGVMVIAESRKELQRRGMQVNHKRVQRLMKKDNLLAVQPRALHVVTTDSKHELEVYLNLARSLKLTGINQLWVADITYIRLQKEFVYLAVILDAFSRKVVGWALDRTLAARLPKAALEMALADTPTNTWTGPSFGSGRAIRFADYIEVLEKHEPHP